MKVLMINVVCGIRSTGRICTDIADALTAQGHEVKIAYGRETVPEKYQKYAVRIGSDFGVKLHGLRARLLDGAGFGSKSDTKKFIEWVKEFDPDVIHLHNIHGYYINIEVLFDYLRTCGKKIIWTLHDCWAFTGHSAYCDAVQCDKWKSGCDHCPQIKEYPKSYLDRSKRNWKMKKKMMTGIRNFSIVTPSHWLEGLVKESFLNEYPVKVIHNGIDTSQFYPMENDFRDFYDIGNRYILLGVASTWNDMKGYSDFFSLSKRLDDDYKIVMVGLTDEQIAELPGNILGIKRTESVKELAQIYSAADLFLNLTYCDNYPTVHLEAISCGTPVVSYDTGGCSESILNCGDVVEQGNITALIETIKRYKSGHGKSVSFDKNLAENKSAVEQYTVSYSGMNRGGYWKTKARYKLLGTKVLLGVASVWDSRKGLEYFLELEKLISESYRIVLVGLTKEQIQSLPDSIIAFERTNSVNEMRELYGIADIFVNPTLEDNYPTTNLEARACGTLVITYRVGGSPESAGLKSLVVDLGDVKGLINGVEKVTVKNYSTKECKDFQKERLSFSLYTMTEMYTLLYKEMPISYSDALQNCLVLTGNKL